MISSISSGINKRSFAFSPLRTTCQSRVQTTRISMSQNINSTYSYVEELKRQQQITKFVSTCGFKDGDANQPRTADFGFDCRVDTQHAIWGFCPTTVIIATDCGLAGNCVDSHSCSNGCGITGTSGITTFTCTSPGADFCSTALLTAGPDQTYSYLACAKAAETVHLLAEASTTSSTSMNTASSSSFKTIAPLTSSTAPSLSSVSASTSTSLPTQQLSSTSAPPTLVSVSPLPSNSPTATVSTSNFSSDNVGAIVGGVIGGLALISFVILTTIFLRRYRRVNHNFKLDNNADANASSTPWRDEYEIYNINTFKHPYWKRLSPIELSTQRANSPFELSS